MDNAIKNNKTETAKLVCLLMGEAFAVFSLIRFAAGGVWTRTAWAVVTIPLLFLPKLIEIIMGRKMNLPVYILGILYSIGPTLGHSYCLYRNFTWWDELLHFTGGVAFALIGFEIARKFCREKTSAAVIWFIAVFGICFSISLSVIWEFIEYGCDLMFGFDMQGDTVVNYISSYNLGAGPGITGGFTEINEVTVNGQPLGLGGYLDIGLHDTMTDLLAEALGAVIAFAAFVATKGRLGMFRNNDSVKKQENAAG